MIRIAVACYDNIAPAPPISAVFGQERKTLGRSENNFLVLPDPTHEVSRSQAAIWSDGARHRLVNLSNATPIRINGAEIDAEQDVEIRVGDQIQIGLYLLRAEQHSAADEWADEWADAQSNSVPARHTGPDASGKVEASLPIAPEPIAAHDASAIEALKTAFLRGAGIPASTITTQLSPELMEILGTLMAASIQGAIELIALRSLVKHEAKADVTVVVVRNNNPLKFFPDSQTVLTQMLRKKMPGFMGPLESIEDAYRDLRGHQIGVAAGMRATMDSMLERLKPDNVEAALATPTMLETLIPSKRQAAKWALYSAVHAQVAAEAKDDFQSVFGASFLAAYEREVERFNDGSPHG